MITILLAGLKWLLNGFITKLLPLILQFWREILICLMLLVINHYKTSYEAKTQELDLLNLQLHSLAMQKQQEFKLKDEIHAKNVLELKEKHKAENDARDLDRAKITKDLKNEINRNSSLFNDVILYQNRAFSAGLPKDEIPADILTEGARDCNRTIAILTKAGQSCSIDYNGLYDAWMKQCDVYGCE